MSLSLLDDAASTVDPYNVIDFDRNKLIMDLPSRQVARGAGGTTVRQRPKTGTTRAKSKRSVRLSDIDSDEEDDGDEHETQKQQQSVKAMATSMESKRQARYS